MLFPSLRLRLPPDPRRHSPCIRHRPSSLSLLRILPGLVLLFSSPAWAQLSQSREGQADDRSVASLDSPPSPEIAARLCDGTAEDFPGQLIITSETVCQSGLTPPSLWWTKEHVAEELRTGGKLVSDWAAPLKTSEQPGQVRLIVNSQMWSLMDYFERYDFVSNFGLAAQSFGYGTEIYNTKGDRLAGYTCNSSEGSASIDSGCVMDLRSFITFGRRSSGFQL